MIRGDIMLIHPSTISGPDVEIGKSYLRLSVVNMWKVLSLDVFTAYKSIPGTDHVIQFTVDKVTRTGDKVSKYRALNKNEVTDKMKAELKSRRYTF